MDEQGATVRLGERVTATAPYGAARGAKERIARLLYERGRLDTSDPEPIAALERNPEINGCGPSPWRYVSKALRRCELRSDDVFLDLGAGKGRVVYQAAQYPFARVLGVEIVRELYETARSNIDANRHHLTCRDVELIHADATEFQVPDDVTYVYLYSPFTGEIFRQAIQRVIESVERRPRRLTLIYANPEMDEHLRATGKFELTRMLMGVRRDLGPSAWIGLYSSV